MLTKAACERCWIFSAKTDFFFAWRTLTTLARHNRRISSQAANTSSLLVQARKREQSNRWWCEHTVYLHTLCLYCLVNICRISEYIRDSVQKKIFRRTVSPSISWDIALGYALLFCLRSTLDPFFAHITTDRRHSHALHPRYSNILSISVSTEITESLTSLSHVWKVA